MMSHSEYRREMLCDNANDGEFMNPVHIVRSTERHIKRLWAVRNEPGVRESIRASVRALRVERDEAEEWGSMRDYEDYRDQVCNEPR